MPVKYPPLPKTVEMAGGTVTVTKKTPIVEGGVHCWGVWDESTRTITIDSTCTPRHMWKIYYHELMHVTLDDSGLSNGMQDELVEAICDCASVSRMRERFG